MKKSAIIAIILFSFFSLTAQDFQDKNLQGIVDAERAFAAMAKEQNTRAAFLAFLSDQSITYGPTGPVDGKTQWESRPVNESLLSWYPTFADIAASGDFGFDFGPWEFRAKPTDEKAVAFGHFVTVWKKEANGNWKVATDIGISHDYVAQTREVKTSRVKSKAVDSSGSHTESTNAETNFIGALKSKGISAYRDALSAEAKVFRNGNFPAMSQKEIDKLLEASNVSDFKMAGSGIASSGDMAFVYGTATSNTVTDGKSESKPVNYLRIWKREDGKNWKLVLDIIS